MNVSFEYLSYSNSISDLVACRKRLSGYLATFFFLFFLSVALLLVMELSFCRLFFIIYCITIQQINHAQYLFKINVAKGGERHLHATQLAKTYT